MARMLGERILPESVQSRRRRVRERLQSARRPLRQKREQLVPGPDVVGKAENTFSDLRDRIVGRSSVLSKIRERRADSGNSGSGDVNDAGSSSSDNQMT